MTTCTRCETTGFLNLNHIEDDKLELFESHGDFYENVKDWISSNEDHDVQVCDCCGDGEGWYGEPGEHYHNDDPVGQNGPYAYNGCLCECH